MKISTPTALLLACTCLLLGSTGGAVAGSMITGKQIKNESVTGKDVKDGTLMADDLSAGTASSLKGPPGSPGTNGTNGTNGVSGYHMRFATNIGVADGASASNQAACLPGSRAVGGGAGWFNGAGATVALSTVSATVPLHANRDQAGNPIAYTDASTGPADAWGGAGVNHQGGTANFTVWVFCANLG